MFKFRKLETVAKQRSNLFGCSDLRGTEFLNSSKIVFFYCQCCTQYKIYLTIFYLTNVKYDQEFDGDDYDLDDLKNIKNADKLKCNCNLARGEHLYR